MIRKQGKLVEMHPYGHTSGFASLKSLHRVLPRASLRTSPLDYRPCSSRGGIITTRH
jgi:hypothetical protein